MSDILRDHALTHIWAEPLQDSQHKIKPARISPPLGFYKEARVMWEKIPLPNYRDEMDTRSFHVYPLGQLPPHRFAIDLKPSKWYRADELIDANNTVIDVYADNGAVVPRMHYYLYLNYDNNLILAIARNVAYLGDVEKTTPYGEVLKSNYTLDDHGITIRFYNNAVTQTNAWQNAAAVKADVLNDYHLMIRKAADYTSFMNRVQLIRQKYKGQGRGIFFQDGFIVNEPKGFKDDYIDSELYFQYDETIKDVRQFDVDTIPGFRSVIDTRTDKYLLLSKSTDGVLEYHDDCDFYVVSRNINDEFKGVRLDNFDSKGVRQVTHNAWSVAQNLVVNRSQAHDFLNNLHELTLLVVVRNGGMIRGIEFQHNRIEELYHLPYNQILEAMVGANSGIPEWRAEVLENSAYIRVMSSQARDITSAMVEDAYGYNAATKAVAKALYPVVDGRVTFDDGLCVAWNDRVPNAVRRETQRSLFWYDQEGKLLGYSANNTTAKTISVPVAYSNAKKVEVILGKLVIGIGDTGTTTDSDKVYDPTYGYYGCRNYVCNIVGGGPDNKWVDATGSPYVSYVVPPDGSTPYVQWNYNLLSQSNLYPGTRFANTVNVHTPNFALSSFTGVFSYDIGRITNGAYSPLQVPPGHIDVYMNGLLLIHNLDYYYANAGSIVIVRKPSTTVDLTKITIRFYGFANPKTNKPFEPRDVGFVKNGLLSVNQKFNLWHDRDIRITVDGRLKFSSEVKFVEVGSPTTGNLIMDGKPYAVEDYQSLVEPFTELNTVDYLMESMDVDDRVSNYLTPRLPEPEAIDNYITPSRHELYSPVMSMFIQLMQRGALPDRAIDLESTDQSLLRDYGYVAQVYGPYDPAVIGFDKDFCYVHPHPHPTTVQVTSKQYAFLERVNRLFLRGALDLTSSVTIKLGT